jgi:hypothetical protein
LQFSRVKSYCADLRALISFRAFFLAAYQACFLTFVSVYRHSVSDPFPYLSCRPCLPLRVSPSPVFQKIFLQRGFCFNCNLAYFSKSVNYRFQEIVSIIVIIIRLEGSRGCPEQYQSGDYHEHASIDHCGPSTDGCRG